MSIDKEEIQKTTDHLISLVNKKQTQLSDKLFTFLETNWDLVNDDSKETEIYKSRSIIPIYTRHYKSFILQHNRFNGGRILDRIINITVNDLEGGGYKIDLWVCSKENHCITKTYYGNSVKWIYNDIARELGIYDRCKDIYRRTILRNVPDFTPHRIEVLLIALSEALNYDGFLLEIH